MDKHDSKRIPSERTGKGTDEASIAERSPQRAAPPTQEINPGVFDSGWIEEDQAVDAGRKFRATVDAQSHVEQSAEADREKGVSTPSGEPA